MQLHHCKMSKKCDHNSRVDEQIHNQIHKRNLVTTRCSILSIDTDVEGSNRTSVGYRIVNIIIFLVKTSLRRVQTNML